MKTKIILFLLGLGTGINLTLCTQWYLEPVATWRTGVFSTLEYLEEPGDLTGTEIYIFHGGCDWVLFQQAMGESGTPHLVRAEITDDKRISFDVPHYDGQPTRYTGRITPKALYLNVHGGEQKEEYVLPRKKGYWE